MPDDTEVMIDQGLWNAFLQFSAKSDKYNIGIENKEDWYNK